jgi:cell division protein ZapA (FtsZ GTPase activity inhibitor)
VENQLVAIQIDIAGRAYPLKVNVAEEQEVREIVSGLNTRLKDFQAQFPRQEKVDYLSMALLTYATDLRKASENAPEPIIEKVIETVYLPAPETASASPILSEQLSAKLSDLEELLDKLLA